ISTPGRLVLAAPTTLRNSAGAVILGSKVSTWVGPPASQSQTTEVFLVGLPACLAAARARKRSGSRKPPRPKAPTLRKSRRVLPSQVFPCRDPHRFNTVLLLSNVPAKPPGERPGSGRWLAGRKGRDPPVGRNDTASSVCGRMGGVN